MVMQHTSGRYIGVTGVTTIQVEILATGHWQARKMWREIGKACEWKHPRTSSVRLLWDEWATEAVLEFLRTTRVGCVGTERVHPEEEEGDISEGEEGEPGPP